MAIAILGTWTSILSDGARGNGVDNKQSSACHVCTTPHHDRLFLQWPVKRIYEIKLIVSTCVIYKHLDINLALIEYSSHLSMRNK